VKELSVKIVFFVFAFDFADFAIAIYIYVSRQIN